MKDSTQHPVTSLVVGDITVLQDAEGRYCLSDLHKAAGGDDKHRPSRWTRTDSYLALEAELRPEMALAPAVSVKGGAAPGTYVVKELVYAYAMWISAKFTLRVIRAYDAMVLAGSSMNLSAGMSMTNWISLFKFRDQVMQNLASCNDRGVADGFYGNLLHVSRVLGLATPPLETLAPGLRQGALPLGQGGAA